MILIEGGRSSLYQWDLNQRVILSDIKPGTQVHFSNSNIKEDECPVVISYEENGKIYADIPNYHLQVNGVLCAYIYTQEEDKSYTKQYVEFIVISRKKPADYVYTETEVIRWETFEARVDTKIEEIEETANNANATSSEAKVNSEIAETKANTAIEDAESALAIARGANQALTFNDYNECCSWIMDNRVIPNETYPIGNVLLIKTLYVPDLYIYGESEVYTDTIPTNDEILESLKTNGYFDIGSCRLAQLETQKVDLSDYAKKAQVPVITTTLKDNGAYTLTITKGVE